MSLREIHWLTQSVLKAKLSKPPTSTGARCSAAPSRVETRSRQALWRVLFGNAATLKVASGERHRATGRILEALTFTGDTKPPMLIDPHYHLSHRALSLTKPRAIQINTCQQTHTRNGGRIAISTYVPIGFRWRASCAANRFPSTGTSRGPACAGLGERGSSN